MPVFYSPLPDMQASLGGSVFTNNRTADGDFTGEQEDTSGWLAGISCCGWGSHLESRRDALRRDHVTFSEGFILFARQRASSEIFHDALLLTIFVVVSQSTGMSHYTELIEMRNYYSRVSKNDSNFGRSVRDSHQKTMAR